MKTIFITSFHPHISRNILLTPAFEILKKEPDLRLVLIVPDYKVEYFKKQFGDGNVCVEGVKPYAANKTKKGIILKRLGMYLCPTETVRLRRKFKYYCDHKIGSFLFAWIFGLLGRSQAVRTCIRLVDLRFSSKGFFNLLLDRYHPDFIFSTDPQNDNDVSLMQDARSHGIPIIAMVRSWDNPTQRIFRIFPDRMLAGSIAIGEECVVIHGFPKEKLVITGQPHYDRYLAAPIKPKEQFFKEFGLDPNKRLIMYAPVGDVTLIMKENDMDQYVMEILASLDAQVLVRFPPDENVRLVNFNKPPTMVIHRPGHAFKNTQFTDREIRREDDDSLIDQIYYSSVVVTGPTSICLDAAFMDKPVIAVDCYPSERDFFQKVYQYSYSHMKKMLGLKGVHFAATKDDLLAQINTYLENPAADSEGRARIRRQWFSHADGHACERVAAEVLAYRNENNPNKIR